MAGALRAYWRWYATDTLSALFGWYRFNAYRGRDPETMALPHAREQAMAEMSAFTHWVSLDIELLASGATERAVRASPGTGDTPLIVLSGENKFVNEATQVYEKLLAAMLAQARPGQRRTLGGAAHTKVLTDPRSITLIAQAARDLAALRKS